jgi:hypothetical protein
MKDTKPVDRYYHDLEDPIRNLSYMSEITRSCAHDLAWPSGLTEKQYRDISLLLFLIRTLDEMTYELEKTYDIAFSERTTKAAA